RNELWPRLGQQRRSIRKAPRMSLADGRRNARRVRIGDSYELDAWHVAQHTRMVRAHRAKADQSRTQGFSHSFERSVALVKAHLQKTTTPVPQRPATRLIVAAMYSTSSGPSEG